MTNAINYQGGVVMLVAVLALVTGVATGAAEPGVASDNDTNASSFLSDAIDDTTNLTTDTVDDTTELTTDTVDDTTDLTTDTVDDTTNLTTDTVDDTTNLTTDTVDDTTNLTTDTVDDTTELTTDTVDDTTELTTDTVDDTTNLTTDTVDDTTDLTTDTVGNVSTTVVGILDVLTESDRLLARGVETDAPGSATDSAEPTSGPVISQGPPVNEQSTPTTGDSTTGNRAEPVTSGGTTVEDRALAVPGTTRPSPGTGVAISLQVIAAGVALRKLAGLPAPTQTAVVTGRRLLDRLTRMVVPLRYSRYDDSDPLEHEDRVRVFDTVNESPGIYLTALSEQTGVVVSTLRHHVRVLEDEGLIAAASVRGRRRFYPAHTEDVELAAALNDEATAPVIDTLARLGSVSVSELADAVDRDASTVSHHLQNLEADGLVVRKRNGRTTHNRLAPEALEALEPLREADAESREAAASAD